MGANGWVITGGILGLISFIYTFASNVRAKSKLQFDSSSMHLKSGIHDRQNRTLKHATCTFTGIVKNPSINPNTIVRFYLVVWEKQRVSSTLRYGHVVEKVTNEATQKELKLPLSIPPRSALNLSITFTVNVMGDADERVLAEMFSGGPKFEGKMPYEFLMEDVSGNLFHYRSSKLVNGKLVNLWWTLPNYKNDKSKYALQCIKIAWQFMLWKITNQLARIGLYR